MVSEWLEASGITTITSGPDLSNLNGSTNYSLSASASFYTDSSRNNSVGIPVGAQEWLGSSDYTLQPTVTCNPSANLRSKFCPARHPGNMSMAPALHFRHWNAGLVESPGCARAGLLQVRSFHLQGYPDQ